MAEEIKKNFEAIEEIEKEVVNEAPANPQASAPTKNAVAAEPSHIAGKAPYEDLGAPVVKPTDSNPDATKKSTKAKDQVNAKAADGDPNESPDTEKGVTKVSTSFKFSNLNLLRIALAGGTSGWASKRVCLW